MSQPSYALANIDDTWSAVDIATLLFVLRDDQVLLIRKKRGLGAGKINGPGGKLEPGETPAQCAIREVQEELGVTATDIRPHGELRFQFVDDYSIHVYVFTSTEFTGDPIETDEAIPLWTPVAAIPYEQMWEDDAVWLPRVLGGEQVNGRFIFDKDRMLEHEIEFS